jgi:hypothetical protein
VGAAGHRLFALHGPLSRSLNGGTGGPVPANCGYSRPAGLRHRNATKLALSNVGTVTTSRVELDMTARVTPRPTGIAALGAIDLTQPPDSVQPAYSIFNACLALASVAGWRVPFLGRNLGDKSYATFIQRSVNNINPYVARDDTRYVGNNARHDVWAVNASSQMPP